MNPVKPEILSLEERLAELCQILGQGLIRLQARQSSEVFRRHGESSLAYSAKQSGHAETLGRRRKAA